MNADTCLVLECVLPCFSTHRIVRKHMLPDIGEPKCGGWLKYFGSYSDAACKRECAINATLKFCGCIADYSVQTTNNSMFCTINQLNCLMNYADHEVGIKFQPQSYKVS